MNRKAILAVVGGVAAGIIAVVLVQTYLQRERQSIFSGMEMVSVLVAADDLPAGTKMTKNVLSKRDIPKKYVNGSSVSLKDVKLVLGQELIFPLKKNDPILWSDLGEASEQLRSKHGLAENVTRGERAFSMEVNSVSGVSGMLKPGDHVDILTTIRNPQTGETTTMTLLQNLTILATGSSLTADEKMKNDRKSSRTYSTITLQVTLEEAELLLFSADKGTLTSVLRNPADINSMDNISTVNYQNILKDEYRLNLQKKRDQIEVIKSGKVEGSK